MRHTLDPSLSTTTASSILSELAFTVHDRARSIKSISVDHLTNFIFCLLMHLSSSRFYTNRFNHVGGNGISYLFYMHPIGQIKLNQCVVSRCTTVEKGRRLRSWTTS